MEAVFIDTHIVLWLYQKDLDKFSAANLHTLKTRKLYISAMVELELYYLFELNKLEIKPNKILEALAEELNLQIYKTNFQSLIKIAKNLTWTRDPFDRLITAEAKLYQAPLITANRHIREHYKLALW